MKKSEKRNPEKNKKRATEALANQIFDNKGVK